MRAKPTTMARMADRPAKIRMAHSRGVESELLVAAFGGEY